jgi:radical SAM superfamily enzyme YgiQ (UPF0313 family)
MDNILPLNKKWFFEFIDMYKKEIGLPYSCRHHPSLVDKDVVKVMKETGCYLIHFGVESGNEFILKDVLNRSVTREQIKSAFKACHDAGISVLSYNMIGLPLETLQMTLDTIKLNAEIGAERMMHPIFYPFPKTRLYDLSVEKGFIPPNLDYTKEVQLTQPQYPQEQVLFVRSYFSVFVRLYRLIFKLSPSTRKTAENIVDKIFTTKYKPHNLLVKLADKSSKMMTETKLFIRTYFPDVYLYLRDMRIKRREKVAYYEPMGGEE